MDEEIELADELTNEMVEDEQLEIRTEDIDSSIETLLEAQEERELQEPDYITTQTLVHIHTDKVDSIPENVIKHFTDIHEKLTGLSVEDARERLRNDPHANINVMITREKGRVYYSPEMIRYNSNMQWLSEWLNNRDKVGEDNQRKVPVFSMDGDLIAYHGEVESEVLVKGIARNSINNNYLELTDTTSEYDVSVRKQEMRLQALSSLIIVQLLFLLPIIIIPLLSLFIPSLLVTILFFFVVGGVIGVVVEYFDKVTEYSSRIVNPIIRYVNSIYGE